MTDGDRLLAAILAAPDEDTPRLMYADWLEENGAAVECRWCPPEEDSGEEPHPADIRCPRCGGSGFAAHPSRHMARFIRVSIERGHDNAQGEFQRAIEHTDPFDAAKAFGLPEGWAVTCYRKLHELRSEGVSPRSVLCVRGFVAEVRCPLAAWLAHGPAVVRRHPVQVVRLTDREPYTDAVYHHRTDATHHHWYDEREVSQSHPGTHPESDLPGDVYDALTGGERIGQFRFYPTSEAAHADLSQALIAWAKARPA